MTDTPEPQGHIHVRGSDPTCYGCVIAEPQKHPTHVLDLDSGECVNCDYPLDWPCDNPPREPHAALIAEIERARESLYCETFNPSSRFDHHLCMDCHRVESDHEAARVLRRCLLALKGA